MRKSFIIPFCLLMTMFVGCGGTETQTDESIPDSSAFRIALLPVSECKPFLYADSCGLFDSLGVSIEFITYYSAMDADTALMNGSVQMSVVDEVKYRFLNSQCDSDSLRIITGGSMSLSLITSKSARIKEVKSLKEKIIAVTRNSVLDSLTSHIAGLAFLSPLEINRPQINDIRLRKEMLMQAQYDGAILPEPWATECVDSGAVRVAKSDEILPLRFYVVVCDSVYKARKTEIDKIAEAFDIVSKRS